MLARILPSASPTYLKYAYVGLQSVLVQAFNPTPPRYESIRQQTLEFKFFLYVTKCNMHLLPHWSNDARTKGCGEI